MPSFFKIKKEASEEIVEDQDEDDGIDDRLRDGTADAAWTADGDEALMAGHRADDDGKHGAFDETVQNVPELDDVMEVGQVSLEGDADFFVHDGDDPASKPPDEHR